MMMMMMSRLKRWSREKRKEVQHLFFASSSPALLSLLLLQLAARLSLPLLLVAALPFPLSLPFFGGQIEVEGKEK